MLIKIKELENTMIKSLSNRGLNLEEAKLVAEPFIEAQLRGKNTHGISKFLLISDAIKQRTSKPEIIKDKFNYALIDAHKELGYLSAQFATNILIDKVKQYDNASVAVINSYYYSMAGVYARKIAEAGYIGIILNNGGPQGVAPFGGTQSIMGTNPIAVGIPYHGSSIVLDMATSEKTWGEINLAKVEKRDLQKKTFFDKDGNFTTDPNQADAIIPFGGAKGYGLNFIFEILTGALVGAKMGLAAQIGYDLGFFFMAFSPTMFSTMETFDSSVAKLVSDIKSSRKMNGTDEIYLPGEQSDKKWKTILQNGELEIEDDTWDQLITFSKGTEVKDSIGLVE